MKKLNYILITLLSSALAYGNAELKKIDIIQTIAHPALDSTYKGTIDQLALEGFIDGKTAEIKFSNAQGDSVLSNQIARKFASEKADVIIAIPTPAAQSAATATRNTNIPVVFSSVTDPVDAGLTANNLNITGVSNFIDIAPQLELFKEILPNLKKLGFIYNPGEANSVKILKSLQEKAKQYNIEIITSMTNKTTEVSSATIKLIGKVDAIFISNDNTALAAFPIITKISLAAKIPVFVSDTDMVESGALAALGPNQYEIGKQTGKMVAAILRGERTQNIPIEFPLKIELALNQEVAKELGINLSKELLKRAKS